MAYFIRDQIKKAMIQETPILYDGVGYARILRVLLPSVLSG